MKRRDFISLFGGVAAAWPRAARSQQAAMPVIGYLSGATFETMRESVAAFHRGLADAGFAEGRNVEVEYRWAEGHNDRLPALAMDLVRRRVDVIVVASSTPGALAAKAATQTIPIVFQIGTDPVKVGLVASLARPGGNITGVTIITVDLLAKCLELMHNVMPPATIIAVLVNPANIQQAATERLIIEDTARVLGARVLILNASSPSEIELAFGTLVGERAGALVVTGETFFFAQRHRVVELAAQYAVPTIYPLREFVVEGGLISYGADFADAVRRLGVQTGRILRGVKAADLPVEQATKVQLIVNLKTAKTLGITVPLPLLGRADEVIE